MKTTLTALTVALSLIFGVSTISHDVFAQAAVAKTKAAMTSKDNNPSPTISSSDWWDQFSD